MSEYSCKYIDEVLEHLSEGKRLAGEGTLIEVQEFLDDTGEMNHFLEKVREINSSLRSELEDAENLAEHNSNRAEELQEEVKELRKEIDRLEDEIEDIRKAYH